MFGPCYSHSAIEDNHKKRTSKKKAEKKLRLSSTFSGSTYHITSDAYNDSTEDSNSIEPAMTDNGKGNTTPKSMDFLSFNGRWGDNNDRADIATPNYRCGESLWQFIQFDTNTSEKFQSRRNKFNTKRKDEIFPTSSSAFSFGRVRVEDEENRESRDPENETETRNPLQSLTNKLRQIQTGSSMAKAQKLVRKIPGITPRTSNRTEQKKFGREIQNITIATTGSSSATEPLSDDEDELFWNELGSPSHVERKDLTARYSLRSEIGNGSKIQAPPLIEIAKRTLRPNDIHLDASFWTEKNRRAYMEDRIVLDHLGSTHSSNDDAERENPDLPLKLLNRIRGEEDGDSMNDDSEVPSVQKISAFSVFDGHAGALASQFCSDHFSWYLTSQLTFPVRLPEALKATYAALDQDFVSTGNTDGTTACSCIVVGGQRVICANAGDSRAIIVRSDGTAQPLSVDHKPGLPRETERITKLGGKIIHAGTWRIEGKLAVSRAIGDAPMKPFVTSEPDVCEYPLTSKDWFLVIASDGIWDALSNEQVASITMSYSCTVKGKSLQVDAKNLDGHQKGFANMQEAGVLETTYQLSSSTSKNKMAAGIFT
eukprot:CAMPEP_0194105928 /NCGR_PEP_ID=MMETSP0150-20130528/6041_1 /TAXON_ID=122233 /ORGANISM="Chaetoceros debilis, Strain MM31A-1" /LENGTH=596 /DNA_ID=CAMNT_0038793933 /DNA_START=324 /DNA_END=2111 /DNA_ORIENTATION=-